RRPPRQPGRGHPQRRLAAELAGGPRARLLSWHPGPDVVAGGGGGGPRPARARRGWVGGGRAAPLRPRTRPRTPLTPSVALRDGEPVLAFGTPGGDGQDQWSLQFFLAHARFGLDLQVAIDTPSFLSEHFPSSFWPRRADPGRLVLEARHDPEVVDDLSARGH